MCGLWGAITPFNYGFNQPDINLARKMAIMGAERGEDGTGLIAVSSKGDVSTLKFANNPYFMLYSPEWETTKSALLKEGKAFIGHNRAATVGDISDANSHPFQHGHITMVHNGTIRSGLKPHKHGRVDSEVMCEMLMDQDTEVFREINGAWTVIWHDARDNSVNFLVNGERPLTLVQNSQGIYFMSRGDPLHMLVKDLNRGEWKPKTIVQDMHYKVDLTDKDLTMQEVGVITKRFRYQNNYGYNPQASSHRTTPPQSNPHVGPGWRAPSTITGGQEKATQTAADVSSTVAKKDDTKMMFEITKITVMEGGRQWRYDGVSDMKEPMYTITGEHNSDLIGKSGHGEIFRYVREGAGVVYFVKWRTIKWLHEMTIEEEIKTIQEHESNVFEAGKSVMTQLDDQVIDNVVALLPAPSAKQTEEVIKTVPVEDTHTFRFADGSKAGHSRINYLIAHSQNACLLCSKKISFENIWQANPWRSRGGVVHGLFCEGCKDLPERETVTPPWLNTNVVALPLPESDLSDIGVTARSLM